MAYRDNISSLTFALLLSMKALEQNKSSEDLMFDSSPDELHGLLQGVGGVAAGVEHHGPQAQVGQDPLVGVDLVQGVEHGLHPLGYEKLKLSV